MFRSSSPRRRLAAAVTGPALAAGVAAIEHWTQDDEARELFAKAGFCASPGAVKGLDLFGQLREKVVAAWAG